MKTLKKTALLLLLFQFFLLGCSSEPTELKNCSSVSEAKERIDWLFQQWQESYTAACSGPKNDKAKEQFRDLAENLNEVITAGEKCDKLDYKDQQVVNDYAYDKLQSNKSFYNLAATGVIECW